MSNKNCLFFFFAFVPGLSTSFLTAAADKDRCRDLGEVFCLKIHRFLVFCRSVYFGIVLDTPLLSPKGDASAEKIKENRSCMSSLLPFVEVAKISQLRRINGRKDLSHVLGKSLQGRAERGFESGVSGARVTEQKYTIRTLKINPPARHYFFLLMRKTRTT